MHHITMHLDFASRYAWQAFQQLPQTLAGLSYRVAYRPVFLGALRPENSNPDAAEIHSNTPFNPLPLLHLALQTSADGSTNRYVTETLFRHIDEFGADAIAPQRLATLQTQLQAQLSTQPNMAEQAEQWLRSNTQQARTAGVLDVPAFEVQGHVFDGPDSLAMLRDYLKGKP